MSLFVTVRGFLSTCGVLLLGYRFKIFAVADMECRNINKFGPNFEEDSNSTSFYARNEYYIGNFIGSINSVLAEKSMAEAEFLFYMYLSYLAMGSGRLILDDIKENDSSPLLALRYLHDAFENSSKIEDYLNLLLEKADQDESTNLWSFSTAVLYCHNKQLGNALKVVGSLDDLESMALSIYCMLALNRTDLGKQTVAKMQEKSDDATLTQLSHAWILVVCGTEQMQDAFHIYQEFCDKYQPTSMLLNGQAVCHIGQGRYEEAESILRQILLKKYNDYDALINIMVLSHLAGRDIDVVSRQLEQIKQFHPDSDCVKDLVAKSSEFDHLCSQYNER